MKSYVRNKTLFFIPEENLVSGNLTKYRDQMLKKLEKSKNFNDVVFNFKSVKAIDTEGISLLFGLHKEISSTDKTLKFVELNEPLSKVFSHFNLNEQINIEQKETVS